MYTTSHKSTHGAPMGYATEVAKLRLHAPAAKADSIQTGQLVLIVALGLASGLGVARWAVQQQAHRNDGATDAQPAPRPAPAQVPNGLSAEGDRAPERDDVHADPALDAPRLARAPEPTPQQAAAVPAAAALEEATGDRLAAALPPGPDARGLDAVGVETVRVEPAPEPPPEPDDVVSTVASADVEPLDGKPAVEPARPEKLPSPEAGAAKPVGALASAQPQRPGGPGAEPNAAAAPVPQAAHARSDLALAEPPTVPDTDPSNGDRPQGPTAPAVSPERAARAPTAPPATTASAAPPTDTGVPGQAAARTTGNTTDSNPDPAAKTHTGDAPDPTAQATGQPGLPSKFRRGRVAYLRCKGAEQAKRPPCPRDTRLEADAWQALRTLQRCPAVSGLRGVADLRLSFVVGREWPEVTWAKRHGRALPESALGECLAKRLHRLRTRIRASHLLVSFRLQLGPP